MKLDGVCKINSALGMEYQFGEFYIDRDYLVFDQDFSLGMKKRQTFPVAKLGHMALVREEEEIMLTFSCDNIEDGFEQAELVFEKPEDILAYVSK
ncbi:TPA: hypothetical protein REQ84_001882 [Listeria monocytogenes]|nr:hypothetical protein [Listeria monocytogenes]HDU0946070.1 hypothetical protein [Listeria monocytogenes]